MTPKEPHRAVTSARRSAPIPGHANAATPVNPTRHCTPADLDRLDALVQEQQSSETRWQAGAEQDANLLALRGPELRAARTRIRAERNRLRENGRHRVSRLHALASALRVGSRSAGTAPRGRWNCRIPRAALVNAYSTNTVRMTNVNGCGGGTGWASARAG